MANFFAYYPSSSGAANASVGVNGAVAPTSSTEIGFINGSGNETAVSPSTPLPVTVSDFPSEQNVNLNEVGGAPYALGPALSIASMPVVIASDDVVSTLDASDGAVSPGAVASKSSLGGGQYNSTLPTLTNTQQSAIQLSSKGSILVAGGAAVGSPPADNPITVAGVDQNGNKEYISTDTSGHVNVNSTPTGVAADIKPATQAITAQDTASTSTSQANGQIAITGTPTAGSAAVFALSSIEAVEVQVTGTWTGTLSTEISMDGGITYYTNGGKQTGSSYQGSSYTANFELKTNVAACTHFRVRATAAWTGTATVRIVESVNAATVVITNPLTLRDATTQSISNTIKAASTAAVATDTALVVAISPNNTPLVSNNALGSVTPGTAGTQSEMAGMVYESTVTTPTNGQQVALQSDLYCNLETSQPDIYVVGQSGQTAIVNNILTTTAGSAATDLINYRYASVQIDSTGTGGTYVFEISNDNVNFNTALYYNASNLNGQILSGNITASASNVIYNIPLSARYFRLRIVSTITGGSIQAYSKFSQQAWVPCQVSVIQATAASLNATVTGTVINEPNIPTQQNDIASAAITTTTTTATTIPSYGVSYNAVIDVTAVSGTTPTMQVTIQESSDLATNWYNVYSFPQITAVGSYTSPVLPLTGNRIRYVQTIGGTTPSFTRSIVRNQESLNVPAYREYTDYSINPTTTNSTTSTLQTNGASNLSMIVNQGSGGSPVTFALDGSDDNTNWSTLGTVVGMVGGASPVSFVAPNVPWKFIRGRVVTGVASTTISYVSLLATGVSQTPSTQNVSIVSVGGPLQVEAAPGTLTDGSGSTSGTPSTSTQVFAANAARRYFFIQNLSSTTPIWINFTTAATASEPSIELIANAAFVMESTYVSSEAINVISTGTSIAFTAKQG
jgi:hypothetical protein